MEVQSELPFAVVPIYFNGVPALTTGYINLRPFIRYTSDQRCLERKHHTTGMTTEADLNDISSSVIVPVIVRRISRPCVKMSHRKQFAQLLQEMNIDQSLFEYLISVRRHMKNDKISDVQNGGNAISNFGSSSVKKRSDDSRQRTEDFLCHDTDYLWKHPKLAHCFSKTLKHDLFVVPPLPNLSVDVRKTGENHRPTGCSLSSNDILVPVVAGGDYFFSAKSALELLPKKSDLKRWGARFGEKVGPNATTYKDKNYYSDKKVKGKKRLREDDHGYQSSEISDGLIGKTVLELNERAGDHVDEDKEEGRKKKEQRKKEKKDKKRDKKEKKGKNKNGEQEAHLPVNTSQSLLAPCHTSTPNISEEDKPRDTEGKVRKVEKSKRAKNQDVHSVPSEISEGLIGKTVPELNERAGDHVDEDKEERRKKKEQRKKEKKDKKRDKKDGEIEILNFTTTTPTDVSDIPSDSPSYTTLESMEPLPLSNRPLARSSALVRKKGGRGLHGTVFSPDDDIPSMESATELSDFSFSPVSEKRHDYRESHSNNIIVENRLQRVERTSPRSFERIPTSTDRRNSESERSVGGKVLSSKPFIIKQEEQITSPFSISMVSSALHSVARNRKHGLDYGRSFTSSPHTSLEQHYNVPTLDNRPITNLVAPAPSLLTSVVPPSPALMFSQVPPSTTVGSLRRRAISTAASDHDDDDDDDDDDY